jgi:hypothetical protein
MDVSLSEIRSKRWKKYKRAGSSLGGLRGIKKLISCLFYFLWIRFFLLPDKKRQEISTQTNHRSGS